MYLHRWAGVRLQNCPNTGRPKAQREAMGKQARGHGQTSQRAKITPHRLELEAGYLVKADYWRLGSAPLPGVGG